MPIENRQRLVRDAGATQSATALFVWLWTFLGREGLVVAENGMLEMGIHPLALAPASLDGADLGGDVARQLSPLAADPPAFDVEVARLLKALDLRLESYSSSIVSRGIHGGVDGESYSVHRSNPWIASHYVDRDTAVTWCDAQSLSLRTYCRHHVAIPRGQRQGLSLDPKSYQQWGSPALHARLFAERDQLKVLLWPFDAVPRYPMLKTLQDIPSDGFVRLSEISNESEITKEIGHALEVARELKATILLLPELTISADTEAYLRTELRKVEGPSFPLLTLFGRLHRQDTNADCWINEAVFLGPAGELLHVHRKLTSYSFGVAGRRFSEANQKGESLAVLESAIGNVSPLICLDLFNLTVEAVVRSSHADLLLVPSMSDKTTAHEDAAQRLQASQLASTFVCNLDVLNGRALSFCRIPVRGGLLRHQPPPTHLVWKLA